MWFDSVSVSSVLDVKGALRQRVISQTNVIPPSPSQGDRYLSTTNVAPWQNNKFMTYWNGAWVAETPEPGQIIFIETGVSQGIWVFDTSLNLVDFTSSAQVGYTVENVAFVDPSGNDGTGQVGNPAYPYATIVAAQTAILAATLIGPRLIWVNAGTYTFDGNFLTSTLLDYYFSSGTQVTCDGVDAPFKTLADPAINNVSGYGEFTRIGTLMDLDGASFVQLNVQMKSSFGNISGTNASAQISIATDTFSGDITTSAGRYDLVWRTSTGNINVSGSATVTICANRISGDITGSSGNIVANIELLDGALSAIGSGDITARLNQSRQVITSGGSVLTLTVYRMMGGPVPYTIDLSGGSLVNIIVTTIDSSGVGAINIAAPTSTININVTNINGILQCSSVDSLNMNITSAANIDITGGTQVRIIANSAQFVTLDGPTNVTCEFNSVIVFTVDNIASAIIIAQRAVSLSSTNTSGEISISEVSGSITLTDPISVYLTHEHVGGSVNINAGAACNVYLDIDTIDGTLNASATVASTILDYKGSNIDGKMTITNFEKSFIRVNESADVEYIGDTNTMSSFLTSLNSSDGTFLTLTNYNGAITISDTNATTTSTSIAWNNTVDNVATQLVLRSCYFGVPINVNVIEGDPSAMAGLSLNISLFSVFLSTSGTGVPIANTGGAVAGMSATAMPAATNVITSTSGTVTVTGMIGLGIPNPY